MGTCPVREIEQSRTEELMRVWAGCGDTLPQLESYDAREQSSREAALDRLLDVVTSELKAAARSRPDRRAVEDRLFSAFQKFASVALGFTRDEAELLVSGGFTATGRDMARTARALDDTLANADIFQASRNAWTTNGLQAVFGIPVRLTPAVFAYSMLYPYSDNYLDDAAVARPAKESFNSRFGGRLAGQDVEPACHRERMMWKLIAMIESQYPRAQYPDVFSSLLAIHHAQGRSLLLRKAAAGAGELLRISFEKGGTSVLADAYLAAGVPSRQQAEFAFDWGVLLQLGDDLQDVRQDLAGDILTIYTQDAGREPLDRLANRTFHFGTKVLAQLESLGAPPAIRQLIRKSARTLLVNGVGDAAGLYSPAYARQMEKFSPFRFAVLADRRKRFLRHSGALLRLVDAGGAENHAEPQVRAVLACVTP